MVQKRANKDSAVRVPAPLPACTIILFGATGDLTKRKLLPALFELHTRKRLHKETRIIAIGRRDLSAKDMTRECALSRGKISGKEWSSFCKRIVYQRLEFDNSRDYASLAELMGKIESQSKTQNRLFYFATPPNAFPIITKHLQAQHIAERDPSHRWHRLVYEKPFGSDLASARALNNAITTLFDEHQVYRIDHYLGKGFVNEILVLRFSNMIFEKLWESQHIDHVSVTVLERSGVGSRGGYYDNAGAMRDMIQNHLLQLVALTAMEPPATLDPADIHDEKVKVFKTIRADTKSVIRGQYASGVIDKKKIPDYTEESGVRTGSQTETYAACTLEIRNKRWAGVPFYLRTGKALAQAYAEVKIAFKQSPCILFCGADGKLPTNELTIRIQPNEGVRLSFNLADSAGDIIVKTHDLEFSHPSEFGINTPEAYEVLFAEAMRGDQTLFTRWDEVELCWRIVDELRAAKTPLLKYKAGSDGPR